MRLHFAPRTRAIRPRWLLEELEVPYELVRVDLFKQENRSPSHLALSPLGEVPVLVDGDLTLFESTAICLYLADKFPEKALAPPIGSADRGPYLQWFLFAEVRLEPLVLEHFYAAQLPLEQRPDLSKQLARLDEVLAVIDARLDERQFLVGTSFSAADVMMASILHLANQLALLGKYQRLIDYVRTHAGRAATRRAVSG